MSHDGFYIITGKEIKSTVNNQRTKIYINIYILTNRTFAEIRIS